VHPGSRLRRFVQIPATVTRKVEPVTLKRSLAAAVFMGMVGAVALAQSTSPLVGTWTLNVAKSKAPFKSGTSVIEAVGDGIKFTVDLVGTDGSKSHWGFTANYDGKDVPVTGESPYGDTVSVTRVNDRTIQISGKYKGKPTTTHTITVSADGKTRTSTAKGTDRNGKPVDSVSFYERSKG
jgi:hypothetical protein